MRLSLALAALALTALPGCSEQATGEFGATYAVPPPLVEDGAIYARSSYAWHTSGLWVPAASQDVAQWAISGIAGRTCQMEFLTGSMTTDLDLGEGTDTVFDGVDLGGDLGATVLVDAVGGIGTVAFPATEVTARWDVDGVVEAGLSELGPVVLTESRAEESSCAVEWPDAWGVTQSVPSCGALEVDPDGTAFVGGERIVRARTYETTEIGLHADRLAWNPDDQLLYAAWSDDPVVRALDFDGNVVWSADLGGDVEGLDDLGGGYVVVNVERDGNSSDVVVLGPDGAERVRQEVRQTALPVVASRLWGGEFSDVDATIGLVDGGHVDFLGLSASVFVP